MIPITVITGFLGSGKTTLILNLIPQLPKTYKLALLKNEFGDVAIDSQLASSNAISGVQELLNGCICCNLVGQLSDALETLARDVSPDRIVIETSGSAFPATLAMEVNRISEKTGRYILDGVLSVIDVENWKGYEDTSYTAKMQARYTDLIVLNKWELVSERRLEDVEDKILALELDVQTPRTRSDKGWVDKDIVFGLDAKLAKTVGVEHKEDHDHEHGHQSEVEVLSVTLSSPNFKGSLDVDRLHKLLEDASKDEIYRIKAILYASTVPNSSPETPAACFNVSGRTRYILNWAFGRWTFSPTLPSSANPITLASGTATPASSDSSTGPNTEEPELRMTIITAKYESSRWKKEVETGKYTALNDASASTLAVQRII